MGDDIFWQVQQHFENIDRETVKNFSVVLLPDFSVDHLVSFPDFQQRHQFAPGEIPQHTVDGDVARLVCVGGRHGVPHVPGNGVFGDYFGRTDCTSRQAKIQPVTAPG